MNLFNMENAQFVRNRVARNQISEPIKLGRFSHSECSTKRDNNDDGSLFVFGYTCKLYRDDDKANWINSGQHLIPWMNDQEFLIDRYDVRGYLHDLSEFCLNNDTTKSSNTLTDEEQEFENLLNIERFMDLDSKNDEIQKESSLDDNLLRQYSEVAYSYNDDSNNDELKVTTEDERENNEESDYKIPPGLSIPKHIVLPTTMKLHCIIEKTAMFVAQHGLQMEILLKTKQASNSKFEFLSIDSKLNPYYKHLMSEIKSGRYVINRNQREESDQSDSESDDNYLHPSLLSSNEKQKMDDFKIPNCFGDEQKYDSYSRLVKNFKDKFADDIVTKNNIHTSQNVNSNVNTNEAISEASKTDVISLIPKPPTEIEMIIDKLAQHVGQNGENFETSIKALNDKKFDFLNNGHKYHAYYVKRKIHFLNLYKHEYLEKQKIKNNNQKSIAFSLHSKENCKFKLKNNESIQDHLSAENTIEKLTTTSPTTATNNSTKDKKLQEIRKKKAREFLKMLKKENRLSDLPNKTFGPNLPKTNNDIQLSPTIEFITSPPNSPVNIHLQSSPKLENDDDRNSHPELIKEKNRRRSSTTNRLDDITYSPPKRYRDIEEYDHSSSPSSSKYHTSRRSKERRTHSKSKENSRKRYTPESRELSFTREHWRHKYPRRHSRSRSRSSSSNSSKSSERRHYRY